MFKVIQVRLRESGRFHYLKTTDERFEAGDYCIVKFDRGEDYGRVLSGDEVVFEDKPEDPLGEVVRKATSDDMTVVGENSEREAQAYEVCMEKISLYQLDMKLVGVEYTFDRGKMIFYFTASGRVDFRNLVKDLASIFKSRIELRQIGVRDEARILGGIGPCGRELCCSTFLKDFEPINIKMAKEQGLPLNPSKISGLCGRLMCCLRYESTCYKELSRNLPKEGSKVKTKRGVGMVVSVDILRQKVTVLLDNDRKSEFRASEVKPIINKKSNIKNQGHKGK